MKSSGIVVILASSCAAVACAEVEFSNAGQRFLSADEVYTAKTPKQVAFPSEVGTPIFWLDCAETNGWTLTAEGGVLKLPSKVAGSMRYLTSDKNDPNFDDFSWKCWGWPTCTVVANQHWAKAPVLTSPEDGLAGHGVLDFGEQGSERALVFDLWRPDESCAWSNTLSNIGSVFAVYDSSKGGGCFLGGGYGKKGTGYCWHRGNNNATGSASQHYYCDALFVNHAFDDVYYGKMRHFGFATPASYVGFGGCWEALTLCPRNGVATMDATGIGLGDTRPYATARWSVASGGLRLAEMIFFDRVLTDEEVQKVEAYLQTKWLKTPAGWNGNAVLSAISADSKTDSAGSNGVKVTIDAAAGETVALASVSGGHFDSSFVKTGAGTLALGTAPNFNTPIEVKEGTVTFVRRPLPADVPGRYVFRLDAQRDDLITKDSDNNVSRVDGCGGHVFKNLALYLTTPKAKPKYLPDALGAGKPVLDLGEFSDSGAYLKFATNEEAVASWPNVGVPSVCSVVAVVGAQNGGGHLLAAKHLQRAAKPSGYTAKLLGDSETTAVYVDGIRRVNRGYPTPGYHVVALQSTDIATDAVRGFGAAYDGTECGGLRLAEAVVYDRVLSDEELRDASAYLMNKWLGRVPGDYQNPSVASGAVEVQKLKMAEGTTIDVPAGAVAKVGRLDLLHRVTKTGKGTLVLQSSSGASELLDVKDGKVLVESAPDVTAEDELAQGASLHLDAADAASVETESVDGVDYIRTWYSTGRANLAYSIAGHRPTLSASDTLNGKPTITFGARGDRSNGNYLVFGKPLCSVKSAYVVWRGHDVLSYVLGTSAGAEGISRTSYDYISASGKLLRNNLFSSVYTNGVPVDRTIPTPVDQWILVEIHSKDDDTGGLTASALCADRDNGNGYCTTAFGGSDYAEVILFERELSEREKVSTRNYLLKKWFPEAPLTPLPDAPAEKERVISELDVSEDVSEDVAPGETLAFGRLVGAGTLEKWGSGTLAVRELADFSGAVAVQEGVLKLTGTASSSDGPVTDGLVYQADSQWGVTTETAEGVVKVVEWKSKLNDGWTAVPPIAWGDSKPRYLEKGLNGKAVIDMAVPTDTNVLQCLRFKKDGEYALLSGLRTVFWVFGSQNGGGYLLGGGDANNDGTAGREWARLADNQINLRYATCDDPVLYSAADKAARWGTWYVNGELGPGQPSDATNKWFSGGWDMFAWDTKSSARLATADGFGFDRAMFEGAWSDQNGWRQTGQQRLAEVLFYTKTLTADERKATESYLAGKWGLMGYRAPVENAASVFLASDGTLDMDGKDQFVGRIGGTGAVVNGSEATLTLGAIAFDCNQTGCLTIGSTVATVEDFAVNFVNFPANGTGTLWKIADVSGFVGKTRIVVTGVPAVVKAKLRYRDDGLYVEFNKGLSLIIL